MIPLWLTPKVMKFGGIGIALLAVLWCGFYTKGKLVEAKILRMEHRYETLSTNYKGCIDHNLRNAAQLEEFEGILASQNDEIQRLHSDGLAAVARAKRLSEIAIAQEKESHNAAMRRMQDRYTALNAEFTLLTASESCHLAWLEVTQ